MLCRTLHIVIYDLVQQNYVCKRDERYTNHWIVYILSNYVQDRQLCTNVCVHMIACNSTIPSLHRLTVSQKVRVPKVTK